MLRSCYFHSLVTSRTIRAMFLLCLMFWLAWICFLFYCVVHFRRLFPNIFVTRKMRFLNKRLSLEHVKRIARHAELLTSRNSCVLCSINTNRHNERCFSSLNVTIKNLEYMYIQTAIIHSLPYPYRTSDNPW